MSWFRSLFRRFRATGSCEHDWWPTGSFQIDDLDVVEDECVVCGDVRLR